MTADIKVKQFLEEKNRKVENAVRRLSRFITEGERFVIPVLWKTDFDPIVSYESGHVYFSRLFQLRNHLF